MTVYDRLQGHLGKIEKTVKFDSFREKMTVLAVLSKFSFVKTVNNDSFEMSKLSFLTVLTKLSFVKTVKTVIFSRKLSNLTVFSNFPKCPCYLS